MKTLPKLLVFSEGALSRSHGTGAIFERCFGFYPPDLVRNWFVGGSIDPLFPDALNLSTARWPASSLNPPSTLLAKLWNRCGLRPTWPMPVNVAAIQAAVRAQEFTPDIAYVIAYSRAGFDCAAAVLSALPRAPRTILQIQDFFPSHDLGFHGSLRRLAPRIAEVWAVSPQILRVVEPYFRGAATRVDPLCYTELPPRRQRGFSRPGSEFRAAVIGNFWTPELLPDTAAIWGEIRRRIPGLGPLRWHCHPAGVQRVLEAGFEPGPHVVPAPFLSGEKLFAALEETDLSLIPFGRTQAARSDYERFSMPSRLTELCAAGLPFLCLAGRDTPIAEYVATHELASSVPAAETVPAAVALEDLLRQPARLDTLGERTRAHAERFFQLHAYRDWLQSKLRQLAEPLPAGERTNA